MEQEERAYVRIKNHITNALSNNGSRDFQPLVNEAQALFNNGTMSPEEYDDIIMLVRDSL